MKRSISVLDSLFSYFFIFFNYCLIFLGGRLEQKYSERAQLASCPLSKRLLNLMETKKSNLCIAVDVSNSKDLLRIVEETGEEAAVIKTHYDAVADWNENTEKQLVALAQKMNFIILEDR